MRNNDKLKWTDTSILTLLHRIPPQTLLLSITLWGEAAMNGMLAPFQSPSNTANGWESKKHHIYLRKNFTLPQWRSLMKCQKCIQVHLTCIYYCFGFHLRNYNRCIGIRQLNPEKLKKLKLEKLNLEKFASVTVTIVVQRWFISHESNAEQQMLPSQEHMEKSPSDGTVASFFETLSKIQLKS